MKILMVSHKHPPAIGGMETQNFHIRKSLSKTNTVIPIIYEGQEPKLWFFVKLKSRIKQIIKSHSDIDIIYLNDGLMAFLLHWLPSFTNIPIVVTFHGLDLIFPSKFYQKRLSNFCNSYCICVSNATYQEAVGRGFKQSNTYHINNGVDHKFGIGISYEKDIKSTDEIVMVSTGRAVPRKGYSWFVKEVMTKLPMNYKYMVIGPNNVRGLTKILLNILPERISRFLATLNGNTTDYLKCVQYIEDYNLQDRVKLVGKLSFDDMVKTIKQADFMVMPNIKFDGDMEGFGLVILEANMCEKFVLGSDIEGIKSAIIEGENGVLLPPEDVNTWTDYLLENCNSKSDMQRKGTLAKEFAQSKFGWKKMATAYIETFETIVSKSKSEKNNS